MKIRAVVFALVLSLWAALALAAPTACPQHFFGGQAPDFLNDKVSQKTREVCFSSYAVMHSGLTRTPLYAAEHLTKDDQIKDHPDRKDAFHPEPSLKPEDRAELADYEDSGYDRGHMAPSGDMPDEKSQHESFTLANMIPQDPNNNQQLWKALELATRNLAISSGELYVITGPIFFGPDLKRINGRVLVPTYIFKAVYDPKQNQAAAYLVENVKGKRYAVVPLTTVEELAGIAVFPALAPEAKAAVLALPPPRSKSGADIVADPSVAPPKPAP
jgi:endonuclease G, mitochondrial